MIVAAIATIIVLAGITVSRTCVAGTAGRNREERRNGKEVDYHRVYVTGIEQRCLAGSAGVS
jgi:hypothetical protein